MCNKIEYDTYYQAMKELKKINYMIDFFNKQHNLKLKRIYKCKECGFFHLTSIGNKKNVHFKMNKKLVKEMYEEQKLIEGDML